jgi:hypothetical protein
MKRLVSSEAERYYEAHLPASQPQVPAAHEQLALPQLFWRRRSDGRRKRRWGGKACLVDGEVLQRLSDGFMYSVTEGTYHSRGG